jgi:hypothetical protein
VTLLHKKLPIEQPVTLPTIIDRKPVKSFCRIHDRRIWETPPPSPAHSLTIVSPDRNLLPLSIKLHISLQSQDPTLFPTQMNPFPSPITSLKLFPHLRPAYPTKPPATIPYTHSPPILALHSSQTTATSFPKLMRLSNQHLFEARCCSPAPS